MAGIAPGMAPEIGRALHAHQRELFGLCYRLTGCAADAEDLVQETFARAIERPPPRADEPWAPWLVRVATNLAIDLLRRRKRRGDAAWLPAPIELEDGPLALPAPASASPEQRYERLESVTFAFLTALEALTPRQRAAVVLRDVCGWSARETAEALATSEAAVRVLHHRARAALASYDGARSRPSPELARRSRAALEALVGALMTQDEGALAALLADDVRTVTDAGGEFNALATPRRGRLGVLRFHLRVARRRASGARIAPCEVNGLPALAISFAAAEGRQAPRALLRCELDGAGRIRELHWVLSSRKLGALRFPA